MTRKDVAELKRRFKKEDCTFTNMCGCYVDSHKNIRVRLQETFLNLPEEEFYRYLEIAKKALSGSIGNQLLEVSFLPEEAKSGGKQDFLLALRESRLKNPDLLERLYELIIETYDFAGNYLILVFHDVYDVMVKTTDNRKLEESEEVYEYILCAICPVELTKAALGYREEENRIGLRVRDWVVSMPEKGFLFPAFSDRSTDIHALLYYTKNVKESQPEWVRKCLGCDPIRTAAEEKNTFQSILKTTIADGEIPEAEEMRCKIHESLNDFVEEQLTTVEKKPVLVNQRVWESIAQKNDLPDKLTENLEKACQQEFGDKPPTAQNIVDNKAVAASVQKRTQKQLQKQVFQLKQQLEEAKTENKIEDTIENAIENNIEETPPWEEKEGYDIMLTVKPQKVSEIKTETIDGKKYILIPVEEQEQIGLNGEVLSPI